MTEYFYTGMLFLSTILICIAIGHYYITKDLIANGIKTKAKVSNIIRIVNDDGDKFKPVFEYTDIENNIVTFENAVSFYGESPYAIGRTVYIVHSKDNKRKRVISFWGLYRWTIILLSIASPLFIIGGGYILYSRG